MDFEERTVEYGYSGWLVIVPVVFLDGSERAEGGSKTLFFPSGSTSPIPPGENAPTRPKKNSRLVL